jgi:hypothetical protein
MREMWTAHAGQVCQGYGEEVSLGLFPMSCTCFLNRKANGRNATSLLPRNSFLSRIPRLEQSIRSAKLIIFDG